MDDEGNFVGDLAASWRVTSDYREFQFTLSDKARWSDGHFITASDWVKHFEISRKAGSVTHFDFRNLKSIWGSGKELVIKLVKPDPDFLRELGQPELELANWDEQGSADFTTSAGAYYVERTNKEIWKLSANPHFITSWRRPSIILISSSSGLSEQIEKVEKGLADFIFPAGAFTRDQVVKLSLGAGIDFVFPAKSYTYWIAPNSGRDLFRKTEGRRAFAGLIRKAKLNFENLAPEWIPAQELYDVYGKSRLTPTEARALDQKLKRSVRPLPPITILVSKNFPLFLELQSMLHTQGVELNATVYDSIEQFGRLKASGEFDAFQINNDFSSPDQFESLSVTFSESRPLVSLGVDRSRYMSDLARAQMSKSAFDREKELHDIQFHLIDDGFVVPIAYRRSVLLVSRAWNYSRWSRKHQDIRFWKVEPSTTGQ